MIKTCYLDASAIVKVVFPEPESDRVIRYLGESALVLTTIVCFVEALGVLKRKYERNQTSHEEYLTSCAILMGQVSNKYIEIDEKVKLWDPAIFSQVEEVAKLYCLDVSDAFQVIALKTGFLSPFRGSQSEAVVVTADRKLSLVLKKEECRVWYCLEELPT